MFIYHIWDGSSGTNPDDEEFGRFDVNRISLCLQHESSNGLAYDNNGNIHYIYGYDNLGNRIAQNGGTLCHKCIYIHSNKKPKRTKKLKVKVKDSFSVRI